MDSPSRSMQPLSIIIISLLVVASAEGLALSYLYYNDVNLTKQVNDLNARVSELQGSLYPMTLVDDLNRTVIIPHEPQRVVSLEPSDTQIVFALGDGDKLVGVTKYDSWPTVLQNLTSSGKVVIVGGVLSSTINLETIIGLKPDLVLAWGIGGEESQIIQELSNTGIPVLVLAPQNMSMIYNDILLVGKALGAYQNATNVVKNMETIVNYVTAKVDGQPRPTVFYEVWNNPLITASASSFIGQLISLAGGIDLFNNISEQFPIVSAESVVSLNPQVIIATNEFNATIRDIAEQPGFSTTSAAINNRIYVFSNPALVEEPGPRIVEGLLLMAQTLHPDEFSNININVFNDATGEFNNTALAEFS